jgi:hypothetical protein
MHTTRLLLTLLVALLGLVTLCSAAECTFYALNARGSNKSKALPPGLNYVTAKNVPVLAATKKWDINAQGFRLSGQLNENGSGTLTVSGPPRKLFYVIIRAEANTLDYIYEARSSGTCNLPYQAIPKQGAINRILYYA